MARHRGDSQRPDDESELWVRPYTATNGRTKPSTALDLMSLVIATGRGLIAADQLGIDHAEALHLCHVPTPVVEIAAHLRQPVMTTKVLLSDLIESGALIARHPTPHEYANTPEVLETLIASLKRL
jgi:hypothetical protein